MIIILAKNYDSEETKEFEDKVEAEKFCADYLAKNRTYGGKIHAYEGRELKLRVVEVVDKIELS